MSGLKSVIAGHRPALVLSAVLAVCGTALGLLPAWGIWRLSGDLAPGPAGAGGIWWLAGILLAGAVLRPLLMAASVALSHSVAWRVLHALRCQLAAQIGQLPLAWLAARPAAQLRQILVDDVDQLEDAIAHAVPDLAAGLAVPVLACLAIAVVDWRMGLASVAILPVLGLIYGLTLRCSHRHMPAWAAAEQALALAAGQFMHGMQVIRAFWRHDEVSALHRAITDSARTGEALATASLLPMALFYVGLRAGLLVVLPVGIFLFARGAISAADLTFCVLAGIGMAPPLLKVLATAGAFAWKLHSARAAIDAVMAAPVLPRSPAPQRPIRHDLVFEGVSFDVSGRQVLRGISFAVPEGSTLAITGPSGAGKTTIARLLMRFADPAAGRITLGGIDLRDIAPEDLAQMISPVLQDAWLLNDTLRANILTARPGATEAELFEAARQARVLDFAPDLSRMAGEGGRALSGGERQRVAIARAILRAAPVVVLDEATAALDPENEAAVTEALRALAQGRTTIIIAHRLDTIRSAGQILCVEGGQIVAAGRHETLIATCAGYQRLWRGYAAADSWQLTAAVPAAPLPRVDDDIPTSADETAPSAGVIGLFLHFAGDLRRWFVRITLPLIMTEAMPGALILVVAALVLAGLPAGWLSPAQAAGAVALAGAALALQVVINIAVNRQLWQLQTRGVEALQRRLADHLLRLPMGEVARLGAGEMVALLTRHVRMLNFVTAPAQIARITVLPLAGVALIAAADWRLALVAALGIPVFAVALVWSDRLFRRNFRDLLRGAEQLSAAVLDLLTGAGTLRSLGLSLHDRIRAASAIQLRANRATLRDLIPAIACGGLALDLIFVAVFAAGGWLFLAGSLGGAAWVAALTGAFLLREPLAEAFELAAGNRMLQRAAERIAAVLALPALRFPTRPAIPADASVRFEGVWFSHHGAPVLRDFSCSFDAGEAYALTGPSGAGKSTALGLITRLWDVDQGRITIGGADIRQLSARRLAALVTVVTQEPQLFDGTVAENLRMGAPTATQAEIARAAARSGCLDMIGALPQGFATRLGDGNWLSRGERQRLCIARAVLKDAPIVLLDEATASVDPENEAAVRRALSGLCAGKTVIMISHRPATLRNLRQVVVPGGGAL